MATIGMKHPRNFEPDRAVDGRENAVRSNNSTANLSAIAVIVDEKLVRPPFRR